MVENGEEIITLRTVGGPYPGNRFIPLSKLSKGWPPPEELLLSGGKYKRVSYSSIPDDKIYHPNVSRGVQYKWEETK